MATSGGGQGAGSGSASLVWTVGIVGNGTASDGINNAATGGPIAFNGSSDSALVVASEVFNGGTWDRKRTPNVFKSLLTPSAGDNALWTPTSGKKFRLMAWRVEVTAFASAAAGSNLVVVLNDAGTDLKQWGQVWLPAASATTPYGAYSTPWVTLGNGILSAAANNVLNANLSVALTGGNVLIAAIGTEE